MSVIAFIPSKHYVALSITGLQCELLCSHCKGRYLKGMIPVLSPRELYYKVLDLWSKGVKGILVSGGFTRRGCLPLTPEYLKAIRMLKEDTGIVVSVHPGLTSKHVIDCLWSSHVDFIDFEIPPSNRYLWEIRNLKQYCTEMYIELLSYTLDSYSREFIIPHIIVSSKASTHREELEVIRRVCELKPVRIVLLIEIPLHSREVNISRAINAIKYTRSIFSGEVVLGCMRPHWIKSVIDQTVITSNLIDRIAVPQKQTIEKYNLRVVYACCSIPLKYLKMFPQR